MSQFGHKFIVVRYVPKYNKDDVLCGWNKEILGTSVTKAWAFNIKKKFLGSISSNDEECFFVMVQDEKGKSIASPNTSFEEDEIPY